MDYRRWRPAFPSAHRPLPCLRSPRAAGTIASEGAIPVLMLGGDPARTAARSGEVAAMARPFTLGEIDEAVPIALGRGSSGSSIAARRTERGCYWSIPAAPIGAIARRADGRFRGVGSSRPKLPWPPRAAKWRRSSELPFPAPQSRLAAFARQTERRSRSLRASRRSIFPPSSAIISCSNGHREAGSAGLSRKSMRRVGRRSPKRKRSCSRVNARC